MSDFLSNKTKNTSGTHRLSANQGVAESAKSLKVLHYDV